MADPEPIRATAVDTPAAGRATTYSDEQLDGLACIECGQRSGAMVPVGEGPRSGQLFRHTACPEEAV